MRAHTLENPIIVHPDYPLNPLNKESVMKPRAYRQNCASRRAFTLIELLVVISIIALLVALLLPALQAARATAQSVACLSNERQIGLTMGLYQNDYEGSFPPSAFAANRGPYSIPSPFSSTITWVGMVCAQRYTSSAKIFDCPTLDATYPTNPKYDKMATSKWVNRYLDNTVYRYVEYGYNWKHIGSSLVATNRTNPSDSQKWRPANLREISEPSQTITMLDSGSYRSGGSKRNGYYKVNSNSAGGKDLADARHSSATNILWIDGHASSFAVSDPQDPYGSLGWGIDPNDIWSRD